MPRHIVTGSIAFDYLMTFPGTFTELLLPEHLQRLSLLAQNAVDASGVVERVAIVGPQAHGALQLRDGIFTLAHVRIADSQQNASAHVVRNQFKLALQGACYGPTRRHDSPPGEAMTDSDRILRRTTKLELGLALGLAMNLVAVVWFAATMAAKVDALSVTVGEAVADLRSIRGQSAEAAVLRYRVEQLERAVNGMGRAP